jgi:HD-GYP domain-containing protein (c-di-GMP phosphodiesterase class II)
MTVSLDTRRAKNAVDRPAPRAHPGGSFRLLAICRDETLRLLVRASFHLVDVDLCEVSCVGRAWQHVVAASPDLIVLDVDVEDAAFFAASVRSDAATWGGPVPVLLLGMPPSGWRPVDGAIESASEPFELLGAAAALAPDLYTAPPASVELAMNEKLLLANFDLNRLIERERTLCRAEQERCQAETVATLLRALLFRDQGTAAHCRRVQRYARELTRELAPQLLQDPSLIPGFLLHDIGKLVIPERVLKKPGPLTAGEWAIMKQHTVLGNALVAGVSGLDGAGLEVIRCHHEHWDGNGYPDGLAGDEIPLSARIFAVADALDALTNDRPYRRSRTWKVALDEIAAGSGSQFDPAVVAALMRIEPRLRTRRKG